jgi:hypothetical protein
MPLEVLVYGLDINRTTRGGGAMDWWVDWHLLFLRSLCPDRSFRGHFHFALDPNGSIKAVHGAKKANFRPTTLFPPEKSQRNTC